MTMSEQITKGFKQVAADQIAQDIDIAAKYARKDELPTKTSQLENDAGFLPVSGGTMTGALKMGNNDLTGARYVSGSQLRTTASIASAKTAAAIVISESGWLRTRTPAQVLSDIGAAPAVSTYSKDEVDSMLKNVSGGGFAINRESKTLTAKLAQGTVYEVPEHTVGGTDLVICFNGVLCKLDEQYSDISSTTIKFLFDLPAGSEIDAIQFDGGLNVLSKALS